MKRFILHVGFHKTATSSIQQTCAQNDNLIFSKGYRYPCFTFRNKERIYNHSVPIYSLYCDNPDAYHVNVKWRISGQEAYSEYYPQWNKLLNGSDSILISGEDISTLSQKSLQNLKADILKSGFQLSVIAFIRSPLSFLESSIQQRVKGGKTIELILRKYSPHTSISRINTLQEVFGESINFYSFRDACNHSLSPVLSFLKLIDIDCKIDEIFPVVRNQSLSMNSARLISSINSTYPLISQGKMNSKRERNDFAPISLIRGNKFKLLNHEFQEVKERILYENQAVSSLLGSNYCDSTIVRDDSCLVWDELSIKQLHLALQSLPKHLSLCIENFLLTSPDITDCDRKLLLMI